MSIVMNCKRTKNGGILWSGKTKKHLYAGKLANGIEQMKQFGEREFPGEDVAVVIA
ncbi:hypothetical protein AGMMS50276_28500 [Synergistales bacterium]|nr:hypothetical protein AGMMS50276_28500 [Synergistales bacterium]